MLIGCSVHKSRDSRKYATLYSRWSEDAETWKRYKQKLCAQAYIDLMGLFQTGLGTSPEHVFACSMCGSDCSMGGSETYMTVFKPKSNQADYALLTCESCSRKLHERLVDGAEIPLDRQGVGAQGPNNTPDEWETLP